MNINKIKKIWLDHDQHFAKKPTTHEKKNIEERLAAIFCPGPFYYYIFNFQTHQFDTVSQNYETIIGLKAETLTIDDLLSRVHPEDIDYFSKCESVAAKFLFEFLDALQILNYKVSYCFRNLTADSTYKLFLHQVVSLSLDEAGRLERVLGVHSDISHITTTNNYKLSLFGLNGQPSYTNIDVFNKQVDFAPKSEELTQREIEVLRLLADGANTKEISEALFIATPTVRKHRENILKKTGAKNTANLIARSIRQGLI